jgi:hypothetical protein
METRPAHKRVWCTWRSGSIVQDGGVRLTRLRSFHEIAACRERDPPAKLRVGRGTLKLKIVNAIATGRRRLRDNRGHGRRFWRREMVEALPRHEPRARPHFSGTFPPITRLTARPSKKEHFHAARESLLGLWQTDNRSEHFVLMVRTAEEVVLGSPCGGIESGIACYDRVSCPTWAHPSTLTCQEAGAPQFCGLTRAHCQHLPIDSPRS